MADDLQSQLENITAVKTAYPGLTKSMPGVVTGLSQGNNALGNADTYDAISNIGRLGNSLQQLDPAKKSQAWNSLRPEEQTLLLHLYPNILDQQTIDAGKAQAKSGFSLWHVIDDVMGAAGKVVQTAGHYLNWIPQHTPGVKQLEHDAFGAIGVPLRYVTQVLPRFATMGLESVLHPDRLSEFHTKDGNLSHAGIGTLWRAAVNGDSTIWDQTGALGDDSIDHNTREIALRYAQGLTADDLLDPKKFQGYTPDMIAKAQADPRFQDLLSRLTDEKLSTGRLAANLMGIHTGHIFHLISGALDGFISWKGANMVDPLALAGGSEPGRLSQMIAEHTEEGGFLNKLATTNIDPYSILGGSKLARHNLYTLGFGNITQHLDQLMQDPAYVGKLQDIARMGHNFDPMRFQAEFPELHRAGALPYFAEAARKGELNTVEDVQQQFHKLVSPISEATGGATGVADGTIGKPALSQIAIIPGRFEGKSALLDNLYDMKTNAKAGGLETLDRMRSWKIGVGEHEIAPLKSSVDMFKHVTTLNASRKFIAEGVDPNSKEAYDALRATALSQGGYEYARDKLMRYAAGDFAAKREVWKSTIADQFDLAAKAMGKDIEKDLPRLKELRDHYMEQMKQAFAHPSAPWENPATGEIEQVGAVGERLGQKMVLPTDTSELDSLPKFPVFDQRAMIDTIRTEDRLGRIVREGGALPLFHAADWMMNHMWRPSVTVLRAGFGMRVGADEGLRLALTQGPLAYVEAKLGEHYKNLQDVADGLVDPISRSSRAVRRLAKAISPTADRLAQDTLGKLNMAFQHGIERTFKMTGGHLWFVGQDHMRRPGLAAPMGINARENMQFEVNDFRKRTAYGAEPTAEASDLEADLPQGVKNTFDPGADVWVKELHQRVPTEEMQRYLDVHKRLQGAEGVSRETVQAVDTGTARARTRGFMTQRDQELEGLHGNQSVYYNPANRTELARSLEQNQAYQLSLRAHLKEAGLPEQVTVYRGGEAATGDYASVALDPQQARKVAADASGRSAENIKVTPMVINRDDIVAYGRSGESELIVRNKPIERTADTLRKTTRNEFADLYNSEAYRQAHPDHPGYFAEADHNVAVQKMAQRASNKYHSLFVGPDGKPVDQIIDYINEHHAAPTSDWIVNNVPKEEWPKQFQNSLLRTPGGQDNPVRYLVDRVGNAQGEIINRMARNPLFYNAAGTAAERMFSDGTYDRFARAFGPDVADDLVYQSAYNEGLAARFDAIHDPSLRSQFAEYHKNTMPFFFAHEQFVKRWAKAIYNDPGVFRRAQLTMAGLRDIGWVHRDPKGDYFVMPGTGVMQEALSHVPVIGKYLGGTVVGAFDGRIKQLSAGLTEGGRSLVVPGVGPAVTIPLKLVQDLFPGADAAKFFKGVEEKVAPLSSNKNLFQEVLPAWAANTMDAIQKTTDQQTLDNPGNKYHNLFVTTALNMMAEPTKRDARTGNWVSGALPENATPREQAAFQDAVVQRVRTTALIGSLTGFFAPVTPIWNDNTAVTKLHKEYVSLVAKTGDLNEATRLFYEAHPDATFNDFVNPKYAAAQTFTTQFAGARSIKAPLTAKVAAYFNDPQTQGLMQKYGAAALFLMPQDPGKYDPSAFAAEIASQARIQLNLFSKATDLDGQTHNSILDQIFINRDAETYYAEQKKYYQALDAARKSGQEGIVKAIQGAWSMFKDGGTLPNGQTVVGYLTTRPVLKEYVANSTVRNTQRQNVLGNLQAMLASNPGLPGAQGINDLLNRWQEVQDFLSSVKGDRSLPVRNARADIQRAFVAYADGVADPAAKQVYTSLLAPELAQFIQETGA